MKQANTESVAAFVNVGGKMTLEWCGLENTFSVDGVSVVMNE